MGDLLPEALCKQCHNPIPVGAKLCSHCGSYQDWRSWFSISTTVLALLTALVSVLGIAIPAIKTVVHTPKSLATLESPSFEGVTLRVLALNKGDAPASLIRARIGGEYLAGATKVRLRDEANAIIPPGTKLFIFDIVPLLDEGQSYQKSLEVMQAVLSKTPLPPTFVLIGVAQSDGTVGVLKVPLRDEDMFRLLRDNADRCSSIDKPSFSNGCIGYGEPPEEHESMDQLHN